MTDRVAVWHDNTTFGNNTYASIGKSASVSLDIVLGGAPTKTGPRVEDVFYSKFSEASVNRILDARPIDIYTPQGLQTFVESLHVQMKIKGMSASMVAALRINNSIKFLSAGKSAVYLMQNENCSNIFGTPHVFDDESQEAHNYCSDLGRMDFKLLSEEHPISQDNKLLLMSEGVCQNFAQELVPTALKQRSPSLSVSYLKQQIYGVSAQFRTSADLTAIVRYF